LYFCTSILRKLWQNTILCWLGQLAYLPWNTFKWLVFPNLLTMSVHDDSRNESCTLRYKCIHVWVYTVTERSCICVSQLSILSLSMILRFDFRIFRRCGIFVFFHDIFFLGVITPYIRILDSDWLIAVILFYKCRPCIVNLQNVYFM
jgi:hypothetical protein